jgi:hypothetical protein
MYEPPEPRGRTEDPADWPAPKRGAPIDHWLEQVDTRKMTLQEYKKFLALQHGQGEVT